MEELTREQLLALVHKQQATIARLKSENAALREQIEQLQTENARQAAPFRRADDQKIPPEKHKKSGRPAGHVGAKRPIPKRIDQEFCVPLRCCPKCQGAVTRLVERVQYIEEIPPVEPVVTKIVTYTGRCCGGCGKVESTHPLMTGRGWQASAVHLGPRAVAFATVLNKHHGVTMRKTCRILKDAFGLKLSAGGLSQRLDKLADRCDSDYKQLIADIRAGPAAYVDETSWWVGGPGHWLHVFTSPKATVYQVVADRSSAVVNETLGPKYRGVLVSDSLSIYGDGCTPIPNKHKCIAHHMRAISKQLALPGLRDRTYLESWQRLFGEVCRLAGNREKQPAAALRKAHKRYTKEVNELLARELTQTGDIRIRNRLQKQQKHLLTCLKNPAVEATNNRAERALRPAVIARKVSCGNKTKRGKKTWERLASLAATLVQRGQDLIDFFTKRTRSG